MDYLIDSRLDEINGKLDGTTTHLLQTPEQSYIISGNVVVPAGIEVAVNSGGNLQLSYSDNQLSVPPTVDEKYMKEVEAGFIQYVLVSLGMFGFAFASFWIFKFLRKMI